MTPTGSTVFRTAVVPAAMAAAHRAKVVAGVSAVVAALCLVAGAIDVIRSSTSPDRDDASATLCVGIAGSVAVFAARRAKRAAGAAKRAAGDPGSTWTLVGKLVVAADDRGQPVFEHSFKVTATERAAMLACPPPVAVPDVVDATRTAP